MQLTYLCLRVIVVLWSPHSVLKPSLDEITEQIQIFLNTLLLYASLVILSLQWLLYGSLGLLEIEKLFEKFLTATIETILATALLRLEIDGCFMMMFVGVLAGKLWVWMGEGRLETHEQQPLLTSKVRCVRFSIALLLSLSFEGFMIMYAISAIRPTIGPSLMILVALEFGILTVSSALTAIRFTISAAEAFIIEPREQELMTLAWDERSRRMAHLKLATGKSTFSIFDPRLSRLSF